MRDYTSFHRFSYMRYVTLQLLENRKEMWNILNATARAWADADTHETFHAHVISKGLSGGNIPGYDEFLKNEYRDIAVASKLYARVADMQIWCDEHHVEIPDEYMGM